jgi:hypothetical protein
MRIAASSLLVLAACPATGVYRTADPVPQGKWRVGGAIGGGVLRDTEQETRTPTLDLELTARRGVAPDVDVGARLSTGGLDLSATWRFSHRRWSWALAPSAGGLRTNDSGLSPPAMDLFAQAALVASRPLSRRWTLSLGPSLGGGFYFPESGGSATGLWLGAFAGAGVRAGCWWIEPELDLLGVVLGDVPVHGGGLQLGVAVVRDL